MRLMQPPDVAKTFESYPPGMRKKLMALRTLIFDVAAQTAGVGALEESLKWGRARLRHRRINRVAVLIAEGRIQPAGLAAFDARSHLKTGIYAVEQEAPELTAADIRTFKTNTAAWKSFAAARIKKGLTASG